MATIHDPRPSCPEPTVRVHFLSFTTVNSSAYRIYIYPIHEYHIHRLCTIASYPPTYCKPIRLVTIVYLTPECSCRESQAALGRSL